ncbi:DUF2567 domain-containing protein [Micromonospora sp. M51]|uniref:DUF2567 domain-containing protein n=1 Tax=Micromonospora TaxID=1873 RepID=UPI001B393B88|nr:MULTISPECIES: DUF2567 domain-containing protein [unclassified Micromonospora]MBQ1013816.1 DUF2567 domain-containing protein [Micromonospora sp. M51]MBQ1032311.1 DUF2567 domain-containing protein [Micromonospora sp. C97]
MSPDNPDSERPVDEPDRPAPPRTPEADPPQADPSPGAAPAGFDPGQPPTSAAYQSSLELRFDEPRRPLRAVATVVGAVLALAALGVPLGLLWAALAPDTPVLKTAEGAIYAEPQPEQPIAADGWFSLLGLAFGLLVALAVWVVLRRRRGPVGLVAAVLGTLVAAPVAWQVGRRIGLATFDRLLVTAPAGQAFNKPADLRAGGVDWLLGVLPVPHGNLLLPAFGAAVMYTLLAGWSRWPGLRPEPEPGEFSWVSAGTPAPPAAPEPPAPDAAEPPRG